ncbi:helix-turn-helix domain-containing protein [Paenibacillus aestuarii]|uniref:Helix-turn-helix domain-containing protein n=1 Tax=Paenibacillus aestuarii TaxID=516965 RepID=A0ABW0K6K6_9BACL|nr:AraC family transcriptional regulator [Paenibacillus aestuarii]
MIDWQPTMSDNYGKVVCERNWKWDTRHNPLPDYDLWYAWDGAGEMRINDDPAIAIQRGTCFLLRPGDRTFAVHHPDRPLTVTFIHFSLTDPPADICDNFPDRYRLLHEPLFFETLLTQLTSTLQRLQPLNLVEAQLLLKLMMLKLRQADVWPTSQGRQQLSAIQHVAELVRQSPAAPHSLAQLAEQVHMSPRYLSIKFKQVMGETLEHYCVRMRLERAENLLRYNGMNVSEVAEALGYSDISFFSRQFLKYRGKRPSALFKQ